MFASGSASLFQKALTLKIIISPKSKKNVYMHNGATEGCLSIVSMTSPNKTVQFTLMKQRFDRLKCHTRTSVKKAKSRS